MPRRSRPAAVFLAVLAAACAQTAEELWTPAVAAYNAGDYRRAIATLDQLVPLIVEGSDLSLHSDHVMRVRQAAQTRLEQQLEATGQSAWVVVPEVGALVGPPALAPPAPRAAASPCGETSGACAAAATEALAPPTAAVAAAAACGHAGREDVPTALSAYGVCALAAEGTNAELYQWVHAQLCAGAAVVDLTDARADAGALERQLARWMLEPLLEQGRVVLTEPPAHPEPACAPSAEPTWAYGGAADGGAADGGAADGGALDGGWLVARRPRECDAQAETRNAVWRACVARHAALDWVALVRAPDESLLPARSAAPARGAPPLAVGDLLDQAARGVCPQGGAPGAAEAAAPVAAWLPWLELAEFGGPTTAAAAALAAGAVAHRPPRPALATHVHRADAWGRCAAPSAAPSAAPGAQAALTCAAEGDGLLVVRPRRWLAAGAGHALTLLLRPESARVGVRAARTLRTAERGGGRALDTVDWFGRWHQQACDTAAHDVTVPAQPHADACADEAGGAPWVAQAIAKLTTGDGLVVLRGGASASSAQALPAIRARFLSTLPEPRKHGISQGFVNAMCQAVRGVPTTGGYSADCAPLHPQLLELAHEPSVLELARALLGDDCVLHNAGISLVGDGSRRMHEVGAHQDQPLPTGHPRAWRGRVPPPSHPLALQALWPLDLFEYENGPTFVLPRTHQRAERLDGWLANETDVVGGGGGGGGGLFPARFVLAEPGDVAFVLGSTWHGASSHVRASRRTRAQPRLALLYEYAPGFVEPLHRYPPALIARAVPADLRRLFPLVDVAGGRAAGAAGAQATERACADGGADVVSVWAWPREMRARPGCARASTRVLLRAGRGAMPVLGLSADDGGLPAGADELARALRAGARLVQTETACPGRAGSEGAAGGARPFAAFAAAVRESGVHREAVFLAHRLGHWCAPAQEAARECACLADADALDAAVRAALEPLGAGSFLDLALLGGETDASAPHASDGAAAPAADELARAAARVDAWRGALALRARGLVRAVGVCDWSVDQLEAVRAATGELPDVLQLDLHPLHQRPELRAYCEAHGILVQARGHRAEAIATHPALLSLAASAPELGRMAATPAVVVAMRWTLQAGAALLTRARGSEQLAADQLVFWAGFRDLLTPQLMTETLTQLDRRGS